MRSKSAPDRTVKATFYNLGRDPNKGVLTADGAFVWTIENERGMYVFNVNLPEAGTWGAEFTTEAPGSPAETVRLSFPVRGRHPDDRDRPEGAGIKDADGGGRRR